jgi:hypothetical protein
MTTPATRAQELPMITADDLDLIAPTFGAFNLMRLASYLPQIVAVAGDRNGVTAISISCWTIWVGANASTGLYAWVKLADATLAWVSAFNAACCLVVLILAMYKRALLTLQLDERSGTWLINTVLTADHAPTVVQRVGKQPT